MINGESQSFQSGNDTITLLLWCEVSRQTVAGSLFRADQIVTRFKARRVTLRAPALPGEHEIESVCPECQHSMKFPVHVRSMGQQAFDAGCLWLGCLLPTSLFVAVLVVGALFQDQVRPEDLFGAIAVCLLVCAGVFAVRVRRIRRQGLHAAFGRGHYVESAEQIRHHSLSPIWLGEQLGVTK